MVGGEKTAFPGLNKRGDKLLLNGFRGAHQFVVGERGVMAGNNDRSDGRVFIQRYQGRVVLRALTVLVGQGKFTEIRFQHDNGKRVDNVNKIGLDVIGKPFLKVSFAFALVSHYIVVSQ